MCYYIKAACHGLSKVNASSAFGQRVLNVRQVPKRMYAVIVTGGKQYRVEEGDVVFIEKLDVAADEVVEFDNVIAVGKDDGVVIGTPVVEGAKVSAKVIKNGKSKKITVFKYKAKKDSKTKKGHRQPYTKVQIQAINA